MYLYIDYRLYIIYSAMGQWPQSIYWNKWSSSQQQKHILFTRRVVWKQVPQASSLMESEEEEQEEVEEEEMVVVVVVNSIDDPHEALGWVIYWFLVKFADKKNWLWTDQPTDWPTDRPSCRDARRHFKMWILKTVHLCKKTCSAEIESVGVIRSSSSGGRTFITIEHPKTQPTPIAK